MEVQSLCMAGEAITLDRWKCNNLGWHPPDTDEKKIWIRSKNAVLEGKGAELKLEAMKRNILSVIHGPGHTSEWAMRRTLKDTCVWNKCGRDIQNFLRACYYCRTVKGPSTKKRPQGWIRAATEFNECLHFDHCSLPTSVEGHTKVLLLKDQYSGYLKAVPCISTGAEEVVTALKSWIHQHGAPSRFQSDGAQGLVGKEVSELAKSMGIEHHVTLPGEPRGNGSIEVANKYVVEQMTIYLTENGKDPDQWAKHLEEVTGLLNATKTKRLAGYSPRDVMRNDFTDRSFDLERVLG